MQQIGNLHKWGDIPKELDLSLKALCKLSNRIQKVTVATVMIFCNN